MTRHVCKYFTAPHRGQRRCRGCNAQQWLVGGHWHRSMTLQQFAHNWLPAVSGTGIERMMTVDTAFPFEFNCYESWNVAIRVRFDFTDVLGRRTAGLGTPVDIMNGWRSGWHEGLRPDRPRSPRVLQRPHREAVRDR